MKKLEHRFAGGRRKPDRSEVDIAGGGAEPTDLPPRPESGVEMGGEYGQDGSEGGGDEREVGSVGSPLQRDDLEASAERELGLQCKIDVDEGGTGLVDSSPQSGGVEVPENRGSREGGETVVEGEVGPVGPLPRSNIEIPGDRGPSGST